MHWHDFTLFDYSLDEFAVFGAFTALLCAEQIPSFATRNQTPYTKGILYSQYQRDDRIHIPRQDGRIAFLCLEIK